MGKIGVQLNIPGTEFDEWDQRGDETDDDYAARMERARLDAELFESDPTRAAEASGQDAFLCICSKSSLIADMLPNAAGYRMCPHCGASGLQLFGKVEPDTASAWSDNANPRADMLDALLGEHGLPPVEIVDWLPNDTVLAVADQGPGQEPATITIELGKNYPEPTVSPQAEVPQVTLCNVPTQPLTVEALQEVARLALERIEQEKAQKRLAQVQAEAHSHFEQETFVEVNRACVNEGGNGADCMICTGEACRYDGFGCWAPELLNCLHEADERHSWDPAVRDARRAEMEADLIKLGKSEERRKEMLDKIFAGEPARGNIIYCTVCKQQVKNGEAVYVTGNGSRHMRCSEEQA